MIFLRIKLGGIVEFRSGFYSKPEIDADTFYLQAVHFNHSGEFDKTIKPQLKLNSKTAKHQLQEGDVLFAAKGLNNFAVVYKSSIGKAVASSSFIILRIREAFKNKITPDYLAWVLSHDKQVKLLHAQQLGTTIPSINIAELGELSVSIPPLKRQEQIITVHRLREKEKEITLQLEECKDKQVQYFLSKATLK